MIDVNEEKIEQYTVAEIRELIDEAQEKVESITAQVPQVKGDVRILISGDTHCDINHLDLIQEAVEENDCDKVFVLGDFGYWPKFSKGRYFIDAIADISVPVYFLAGNHDDHDTLDERFAEPKYNEERFIELSDNLYWAWDGHRWRWGSKVFLSLGGAYSIDRQHRTKFVDWFPQEVITSEALERSLKADKGVDIMLTHDAPAKSPVETALKQIQGRGYLFIEDSYKNRLLLQEVIDYHRPKRLFHGHWHVPYSFTMEMPYGDVEVRGLGCNNMKYKEWAYILDV